ncbi:DNA-binding transcriptional regulator, LysR family [Lampropedia hyalina DSM 16112]|jgi:DNA-binding transcriptional LysR family regulator|uniref:DNA-binding transcriptional regulator, LysR family n=1 Tax=Lampropedia hyalina DSM 16112 TaxID=1122156 RepID=A0A1M4YQ66_9BURK|nr:LysR family transcriptional regulator [Lampropedia hyalina]SHF07955.1 DNA-binding transcriptional regulator, LysR family [Lampropedia hyalina DSM 16112]
MDRYIALQVFRQVAEQNSFAAAGRRLGLSPAAISKNVAELEAHLGTRLFQRTTRRVSLTGEGALYLAHVQQGLDTLAEGEQLLCQAKLEPVGVLRVSAPLTLAMTQFSSAIPAFLARHPHLTLELDLSDTQVDLVRDGFDLAIRGSRELEDSGLIARKLTAMPYAVCAAAAYLERHGRPATPSELAEHHCIRFSLARSDVWTFRQQDRVETVPIDARYSVSSSLAIMDALRAGFGLSLIPRPYVAADLDAGRLQTVLDDWHTDALPIYAIYPSRHYLTPKVRAFIEFLQACLPPASSPAQKPGHQA